MKKEMKQYEALFIINPDKESSLKAVTDGIQEAITKSKGKMEKEESWGKRHIAHPVDKNPEGIYYRLDFSVDPSEIQVLNNSYKLNPDILRVMITVKA